MPKVSVIIPCFNQGEFLDQTVDSVLAQSFQDFEIVIVNDGSTDRRTNDLLRDYRRPRTRVLQTANQGVSAARNTAIRAATGAYILPLDADDLIDPQYLAKSVAILDQSDRLAVVTCLVEFFGAVSFQPEQPPFAAEEMLVRNVVGPCSSLFRKRDWELVGGYNTAMTRGWEDWDFWLSFAERGAVVHRIPEVLFYYRIREGSRERSMETEHRVDMFLQLYANHRDFYQRHMAAVFRELCAYHDLICSPRVRLLQCLEHPSRLAGKLLAKTAKMVQRLRGAGPLERRRMRP